jgi:hypothetical protein
VLQREWKCGLIGEYGIEIGNDRAEETVGPEIAVARSGKGCGACAGAARSPEAGAMFPRRISRTDLCTVYFDSEVTEVEQTG